MLNPFNPFPNRYTLLWVMLFFLMALQPALGQQSLKSSIDLKDVNNLQSEIRINAGTLNLSTHNSSQADMRFVYTRDAWKPEVKVDQGKLFIKQPEENSNNMKDKDRNEWDLVLPRAMGGDLKIRMGAGEANVDLEGAKLNRLDLAAGAGDFKVNLVNAAIEELEISAGVGALTLDLSGNRTKNLKATINGGIGDLKLLLPAETGVRVKVNGLGSVDKVGLTKENGYYVNEAYGNTPYSLEITVNGGLGSVDMALK